MRYGQTLIKGRLLRRYKRFLADVELDSGGQITAHTANPGRMTGLTEPGSQVFLTYHDSPRRKLNYSWELVRVGRHLVGINPHLANTLVAEGIERGVVAELDGYAELRREVAYGQRGSRADMRLDGHPTHPPATVEVKNVTLIEGELALFPDAPTERGRKHLRELMDVVRAGERGVLVFVVQRKDCDAVAPADAVDPEYAELLREAAQVGVEVLAYRAKVGTREVKLVERMPVRV